MTHLGALLFNRWLPEAACGPRPQSRGFRFSRASGPLPGHLGQPAVELPHPRVRPLGD